MSMAADETERRFLLVAEAGDREDIKRQAAMAAKVGLGQSLGKIRAWAVDLVELHREEIRTVAQALLERRKLTGLEIDQLTR